MNSVTVAAGLLAASAIVWDFTWFEDEWVSDAVATEQANEAFQALEPQMRERLFDLFGKLRWNVADGLIEVIHPDGPRFDAVYFVRPGTREGEFELMIDQSHVLLSYRVWRTPGGFCMLPIHEAGDWGEPFHITECFKPHAHPP